MRRTGVSSAVCWLAVVSGAAAQGVPVFGPDPLPPSVAAETAPDPTSTVSPGIGATLSGGPADVAPPKTPAAGSESLPLGGGAVRPAQEFLRSRGGRPGGRPDEGKAAGATGSEGWWRTAVVLLLIIALIAGLGVLLRVWARKGGTLLGTIGPGGKAPAGILQVLGRYPMGRGQTMILLKLDRRVLLLCQTVSARGSGVRTLCELTDPEEVSSILMLTSEAEGRSLASRFRGMVTKYETSHEAAEAVLAPVALPARGTGTDPVDGLRSRLVRLRGGGAA
ncbi:MAG: flagellar biosynthetic protein FliO [Phycisphaerales bacterium]|nr:flagellar biosynthetic protein FliO [Phycisphaerales bacterium]